MPDECTTGIILRLRPLTDTSLIVHWLTPDLGRVSTVARGARRPKSPFRGKLDLYFLADFSFRRSARGDLHTLREAMVRKPHEHLRKELGYLQQLSYCTALVEQTTETETPLPRQFEFLSGLLQAIAMEPPRSLTIFAFEMKLLADLGLQPDLAQSKLSAGAKQILAKAAELGWPQLFRLRPSASQEDEIRQFLHGFLIYHLGKIPKGRMLSTH